MKMESQIKLINMEDIIPNRFQPRLRFSEEGLDELAESIMTPGFTKFAEGKRTRNYSTTCFKKSWK